MTSRKKRTSEHYSDGILEQHYLPQAANLSINQSSPVELVGDPGPILATSLVDSETLRSRRVEPQSHVGDVERLPCNKMSVIKNTNN